MPASLIARRRTRRRTPVGNGKVEDPSLHSSNLHLATADLPWYCNGLTSDGSPLNLNRTYTATKAARVRVSPVIIYRDVKDYSADDLTALFSDSSVPGLREICHSNHFFRKIIWFLVFAGLGFLALRDIHQLLSEFYSYPITVDVRLRETRKLPFPAVTVCNLNIVRYSALCNSTLNISMPIELQEKLCGTIATAMNPVSKYGWRNMIQ